MNIRRGLQVPLSLALLLPAIGGCLVYLCSSYTTLRNWYTGLGGPLYKASSWADKFFNPATKSAGNIHCTVAMMVLLLTALALLLRKAPTDTAQAIPQRSDSNRGYEILVLCAAAGLWALGMTKAVPAYDEVFSAVNFAALHPFQSWSYYPLPNNHVLFNTVNSLVSFAVQDKLATARLLSLVAYLLLAVLLFRRTRQQTGNAPATGLTLLLLLQFPVWAFSFQGRGYEWYLLFAWVAWTSLSDYLFSRKRSALMPFALACIAGMATVPTFLYFFLALAAFATVAQIYHRRVDLRFWKYCVAVAGGVYLFYLPVVLFSGADALLSNEYVVPGEGGGLSYLPTAVYGIRQAMQFSAGYLVDDRNLLPVLLAFLPLLGVFALAGRGNRSAWARVVFWVLMCSVLMAFIVYQRRFPFVRNLIAHYSVTLCFGMLALYTLLARLGHRLRVRHLHTTVFLLTCAGLGIHFLRFGESHVNTDTYMYDAQARYSAISPAVVRIPTGSAVGVSDECFFWEYLLRHRGSRVHKGALAADDYFIRMKDDALPTLVSDGFDSTGMVQEYIIYRRR